MEDILGNITTSVDWGTQTANPITDVTMEPVPGPGPVIPPGFGFEIPDYLLQKLELIELGMTIYKYCIPPIVCLGLVGNIFSFVIMGRPFMRKTSASTYFRALAVLDSLSLIHHLLTNWLLYITEDFTYIEVSDILCKLHAFFFTYSLQCAAWLVVAMSAERCLITCFPLKGKLWCTRRTARIVIGTICLVFAVYNITPILALDPLSTGKCKSFEYFKFSIKYGYWAALVLYTLIPAPLLIILNGITIYKLAKAQRKRSVIAASADTRKSNEAISRASFAAVLVAVIYFILTLPSTTLNAIYVMTNLDEKYLEINFAHNIGLVFRTTNNAINFVLYLVSFPRIRAEFISMVTVCCPRSVRKESSMSRTLSTKATEMSSAGSTYNDKSASMVQKSGN